jgi:transposase
MPVEEHGTLKNEKTGDANPHAEDRLMNAVFYKAYNSEPLIDLYASTRDPEAKIYLNALGTVAPKMAKLENAGDYDVRNSVVQAVEAAVNAKRRGINLSDFAKQGEIGLLGRPR